MFQSSSPGPPSSPSISITQPTTLPPSTTASTVDINYCLNWNHLSQTAVIMPHQLKFHMSASLHFKFVSRYLRPNIPFFFLFPYSSTTQSTLSLFPATASPPPLPSPTHFPSNPLSHESISASPILTNFFNLNSLAEFGSFCGAVSPICASSPLNTFMVILVLLNVIDHHVP